MPEVKLRLKALQEAHLDLVDRERVLLHLVEHHRHDELGAAEQERDKMGCHVERNRILVLLDRLYEHLVDELLARHELVVLRTQHLQVHENAIELKLQKLAAHRVKVEQVDQGVRQQGDTAELGIPLRVVESNLLLDKVRGLQVFSIDLASLPRRLCLLLHDLLWLEVAQALGGERVDAAFARLGDNIEFIDQAV